MVYLANGPVRNRMLALLQLLFTETRKSAAEKKKLLQSKYDIDVTSDMEEEMNTMCNLSEGIFEKGMEKGATQEKISTIKRLWQLGADLPMIKAASGWTEEQIMQVVKAEMN